jgi:hypothetical protein
MQPSSQN